MAFPNAARIGELRQVAQTYKPFRDLMHRGRDQIFSMGGAINIGFAAFDALSNMKQNPRMSATQAIGKSALNLALAELIPGYVGAQILTDVAKVAGQVAYQGYHNAPFSGFQRAGHFEGVQLMDTANAATMRQRSLAAISQSQMNARSVLGSEARMLHRNQVAY